MKKQIRVLTGSHAGARLDLEYGVYRIGQQTDADIQLSDWNGHAMELHHRDDGVVTLDSVGRGRTARRFQDLVPRRMGQVVLCIGPCDAVWPTDIDLLNRMLDSERLASEQREQRKVPFKRWPYRRWMRWSTLGLAAASLGGVAILVAPGQVSSAAAMHSPEAMQRSAEQASLAYAIAKLGMKDVHAVRDGDTTLVLGMVATPTDKLRVAGVLERYRNLVIASRLRVAQDVADELQTSLGEPEVSVSYVGDSTFRVAGIARDAHNVQQRVERARIDFGSSIKRVVFDLRELERADTSVSSMLATESLTYVELADGTKSFAELPAAINLNTAAEK